MTDTILCIDIGTSSLKAALLPDNLKKFPIFVSRQAFPKSSFGERNSARFYLPALKAALSELKEKNPDFAIEAICVSGNGPTIISEDGRTFLYSDALPDFPVEEKKVLERTKSLFIPRFIGFRELYPAQWKESRAIFGTPEFLLHELTGESLSILPEDRFLPAYWTEEELESCGFSDSDIKKIPPLKKMGSFVGKVSEKAALATGLFEGTFVFAGAPDFVVALLGTGTVFPGRLCDRAGSSEGLNLCTTKPVFAEGLRTLPSAIPGLWNLSYLLNPSVDSAPSVRNFNELAHGIRLLRGAALSNGEFFPDYMTITGGQALDDELIAQKEAATGLKIKKMPCADAELIGDLILARVALGDFDDVPEAVFGLIGA
ncbi:hypothetical protein [Treponema sp. UBA3813]|uniref:hypothetical protein n=1 Tax=Treponema sp. UBA3813 TaxID=1947715 RepID=UPI0025CC7561|nr:hypothetical protein [Treponema sp. UBA3813]